MSRSEINAAVTGLVLNQLGFQLASQTVIPQILTRIEPNGGTAFRDSLMGGCNLLIKLYQILQQTGQAETWNLVHVILTDGDDAGSKTELMVAAQIMYAIGQMLNVNMLKIIFIGVGVSQKAEQELMFLAKAGGENAEYYRVDDADIGAIFQKITVKLGLERRQNIIGVANSQGAAILINEEIKPFLAVQQQNYSVLFNLDVSGSMSGNKWRSVCQAVARFTNFLGENDLISAMVFNHEAKLLASMSANDPLFRKQQVNRPPNPIVAIYQQQGNKKPKQEKPAQRSSEACKCEIM